MTSNKVKATKKLLEILKKQYKEGIISKSEYVESLEMLLNKLDKAELSYNGTELLWQKIKVPSLEINVKSLIQFTLEMN